MQGDNHMTICTFAGHRTILIPDIERKIASVLNDLLLADRQLIFLSGGMGEFDLKCESAVRRLKRNHPEADLSLRLVLAYMTNRINAEKDYYQSKYDDIIFPAELAQLHYKVAIKKRNQWMAEQADIVLACVCHEHGGAYDMLRHAQKIGKTTVNLAG